MTTNGYRQNYRQGPPPQQQRYDDRSDRRGYGNGRQDYMYDQRGQGYNEQQYQSHDNQYEQRRQWDDGFHSGPLYQDPYAGQPQQISRGPKPQRPHQYDDRYHTNGAASKQPLRNTQGHPPTRIGDGRPLPSPNHNQFGRVGDRDYNHGDSGIRQPKERERILKPQPDSPTTSSWDNPFPAFPSKKKQTESKSAEVEGQQRVDSPNVAQPQEDNRPSTSHGNQPRREPQNTEIPRPHTSHSQRDFGPTRNLSDAPPMPFRRDDQGPRHQTSFYNQQPPTGNMQTRPGPRRVMTGPAPSQYPDDFGQSERQNQHTFDHEPYHEHNSQHNPNQQELSSPRLPNHPSDYEQQVYPYQRQSGEDYLYSPQQQQQQQRDPSGHRAFGDNAAGHRRQSSDPSYRRDQSTSIDDYDAASYRGVTLTKKVSPEVHNFDVISENPSDKIEDYRSLSHQQPQSLAYRKPTYQSTNLPPFEAQQQSSANGDDLASPLAQFSFDLDNNRPSAQQHPSRGPIHSGYRRNSMEHQIQRKPPPFGSERSMQYPQRNASKPQDFPPNSPHVHPSNRPPPFRPGLAQSQNSNPSPHPNAVPNFGREPQTHDYDQTTYDNGYGRDDGLSRPQMPPSQMSYHSDTARQGYDQRLHSRPSFSPHQAPARPATANSARPGPMPDYGPRISSDSYQRGAMQNPDSLPAHPVPFRPGLMQPTPPAPRPTPPPQSQPQPPPQPQMHQRELSGAQPSVESEPPVTIRELNTLRDDYKNHPNDYALGLKFAKRLVEAAKVLASENGRADAKQTAKNRERYILDAYKIVKRLCGSGYPGAMFYLADCYGQGLLGLAPDPKEAFSLYQSAAKLGHAQAAYRVAVCCELGAEEGGGTRRDPLKAVQWYKRAASLGDAPAMYKMGMIQLKGLLSQPKSPREAISWLKRAAERADAENPHALHELGLLYENAQSTDIILKDEKYALQLFQQAADLGYKYSQFRLGSAYEYGSLGLPIDPRMSIAWYSRAAKQGEHQSEFALSGWYLTGSGQPHPGEQPLLHQSDTEAYLWARKAASSGLAKAEYAMGYYTEVGIGVASNIDEAKTWYYRAAAQNHIKARERLEDLKKGGQRMQKTRVSRSNVGKHNEGECTVM